MQSFSYRTYGLNVESEIECSSLLPWAGEADVRVRIGSVPDRIEKPLLEFPGYQSSEDEFLLTLEAVGRFWVRRGEEICVQPAHGASAEDVQAFTFGSLFGVVLHQRRRLPLHASAVATDRGAVLFTAQSGFGKSTIAGEFSRRGYRILADDICAVESLDGVSHMHPARPAILLREDSLERLELVPASLARAPHNAAKRVVPLVACADVAPAPIRAVYALSPSDRQDIQLTEHSGFEKVATLAANVYRVYLLSGTDALSGFFEELATLARTAPVITIERPTGRFMLSELADRVEEDLRECR